MKIVNITDWTDADRQQVIDAWGRSVGFAVGPMPPDVLDEMIAEGVVEPDASMLDAIPGDVEVIGYRYDDADGSSLRIAIRPARGGGDAAPAVGRR